MAVRSMAVKVRLTPQDYVTLQRFADAEDSTPGGLASRIVAEWCFDKRTLRSAVVGTVESKAS